MKDRITVRGTKPGQPRASCFRGALKGRQPLTEDPCISGDGKTMGADDTSLHPTMPWSLTALCRPQKGRCPSSARQSTRRKAGNDVGLCHGLCHSSPVPSSCVSARRQVKAKFINTIQVQYMKNCELAIDDWNVWSQG